MKKNSEHIDKWYHIVSKFIEGYETTNPLTTLEKESICCIMSCIELLFVAYFINNGDELLAQGAANLYYFVDKNQEKIQCAVNNFDGTISQTNRNQEIQAAIANFNVDYFYNIYISNKIIIHKKCLNPLEIQRIFRYKQQLRIY